MVTLVQLRAYGHHVGEHSWLRRSQLSSEDWQSRCILTSSRILSREVSSTPCL